MRIFQKVTQMMSRQVGKRYSSGHDAWKATYNDLPSPCGSWRAGNEAYQRKHNIQLGSAVGLLIVTLLVGKFGGMFEFYNHFPARPADSVNYKV